MDWETWKAMPEREKEKHRDLSGLTPQLCGLEGWRVEVITEYDEKRRFIVGKSTGWKPCHLEVKTRRSMGGDCAEKSYKSIARLYKAKGE